MIDKYNAILTIIYKIELSLDKEDEQDSIFATIHKIEGGYSIYHDGISIDFNKKEVYINGILDNTFTKEELSSLQDEAKKVFELVQEYKRKKAWLRLGVADI